LEKAELWRLVHIDGRNLKANAGIGKEIVEWEVFFGRGFMLSVETPIRLDAPGRR